MREQGSCRGRVRFVAMLGALAALLIFSTATQAFAVPTFTGQAPASSTSTSVRRPVVGVDVNDPVGIMGSPYYSLTVDGAAQGASFKFTTTDKKNAHLSWTSNRDLAFGGHTILISVANTAGKYGTAQWNFSVGNPISFADQTPSASVATLTPTISVRIATGGTLASWNLSIDGANSPSVYNATTGVITGTPTAPLSNGQLHTAAVSATSAAGVTANTSWQFYIQIYAQMPGDAANCNACHPGFPAAHPMDDCLGCHGPGSPEGEGWNIPQYSVHSSSKITSMPCSRCHSGTYPAVPTMHTTDVSAYHVTTSNTCTPCHELSLTIEHYRRDTSFACATCHSSTDPTVQATIANHDTRCTSCHQFGATGHPFIPSIHVSGISAQTLSGAYPSGATYSLACTVCHQTGLKEEHETRASLPAGGVCAVCHPTPRDSFGSWAQGCVQGGCHAVGSSTEQHSQMTTKHAAPVSDALCVGCHTKGGVAGDVGAIHALATTTTAGVTRTSCAICHDSTSLPATTDCITCHPDRVAPHGYDPAKHLATVTPSTFTIGGATYGPYACSDCHNLELGPEHAKPSSSSAAAGCSACHPTRIAQLPPPWSKTTCAQGNCHTPTSPAPQHAQIDAAHLPSSANSGCFSATCHTAGTNLASLHSNATTAVAGVTRNSCAICHAVGVPSSKDCTTCHPATHDLSMHNTLPQNAGCFGGAGCHAVARLDQIHSQATTTVAGVTRTSCMVCHANGTPSSKDCATCHTTQGVDYHVNMAAKHLSPTTSTCFAAGCHDVSKSLPAVHTLYVGPGSRFSTYSTSCALCHQNANPNRIDWATTTAACTACHAGTPHSQYAARHALTPASDACSPCHGTDIATIHGATADASKCATCHSNPTNWSKTADCTSCHADKFPPATNHYLPAKHTGTDTATGAQDCAGCHNMELAPEHAKASSGSVTCLGCHQSSKFSAMTRPWSGSCTACHAIKHTTMDAQHVPLPANAKCTASGCHTLDLAGIHSSATTTTAGVTRASCQVCHSVNTIPATKDCRVCHPEKLDSGGNVVSHGFDPNKHVAAIGTMTFSGTLPYTYDAPPYTTMTFSIGCTQCHLANIYDEHQKYAATASQGCALCHSSPRNTFSTWNKSCQQGGCHTTIHAQMNARHTPATNSCGQWGSDCHGGSLNSWGTMDAAAAHNDYWDWQQVGYANYSHTPQPPYGCATCHTNATTVPSVTTCSTCHIEGVNWVHP